MQTMKSMCIEIAHPFSECAILNNSIRNLSIMQTKPCIQHNGTSQMKMQQPSKNKSNKQTNKHVLVDFVVDFDFQPATKTVLQFLMPTNVDLNQNYDCHFYLFWLLPLYRDL